MVSPHWLSVLLNPSTTLPGKYGKLPGFQMLQLAELIFSTISLPLVNRFFIHRALQRALSFCKNPGNRGAMMRIWDAIRCASLFLRGDTATPYPLRAGQQGRASPYNLCAPPWTP